MIYLKNKQTNDIKTFEVDNYLQLSKNIRNQYVEATQKEINAYLLQEAKNSKITEIQTAKETDLYSLDKYNELIDNINKSNLTEDKKIFLQLAATRHIEFNYSKIAEYYAHEEKETQSLMEDNALVIIDYNKAIELGFVKLFNDLENLAEIDG